MQQYVPLPDADTLTLLKGMEQWAYAENQRIQNDRDISTIEKQVAAVRANAVIWRCITTRNFILGQPKYLN